MAAHALGMKINYYQRNRVEKSIEKKVDAQYVPTLFELMEKSDFVSLHVPYGPPTEKMITYEVLSHMKPSAYFINTSRGGLVDENGLYKILSEKKITAAALDVYRWEPIPADSPLSDSTTSSGQRTMQAELLSSCWRRLTTCFRTLDGYLEEKNQKVGQ